MLFNTLQFAIFFVVVLGVYRLLSTPAQRGWLLAASFVFYFLWLPAYLPLLLGALALNYACLRGIQRGRRPRTWLAASITSTLAVLAYFKYAAFLVISASPLLEALLASSPPVPDILLPLGISFFSFQMIALAIDTYRGQVEPPRSFSRYALFIAFFPQLIAGPILRGREFLPQLEAGGRIDRDRTRRGMWLIATGVAKKVLFADYLLAPFVNEVFDMHGRAPAPVLLLAIYGFAFQIYFDFAGYTDIARGLANLLGFQLPGNFTEPYLSRSPAEFWRRWHITLSSWLRDYLYIPLGGNRGSSFGTYRNLMITMLLGGLWHGAGWNFVIWGGLHGLGLVVHRLLVRERASQRRSSRAWEFVAVVVTFNWTCLLWVFFRAPTLDDALAMLGGLTTSWQLSQIPVLPAIVVAVCLALHPLERTLRTNAGRLRRWWGYGLWSGLGEGVIYGTLAALVLAASGQGGEFIYFQF